MESWWKTWADVSILSKGKRIILYGRSEDWIPKTLTKISKSPSYIVDRNPIYKDTEYRGIKVVPPEFLLSDNKEDIFIVITSGVYEGIVTFLVENGFQAGSDFCCSPEFRDYCLLEEIRNYEQEVIVSCSDYHDNTMARYSRAGGGLFRYNLGPNTMERLVKGSFRQVTVAKDYIYAVEFVECKLYKFDKSFEEVEKFDLDSANYCGIDYDPIRNLLVLVNAAQDTVSLHDADNFTLVDRLDYSNKKLIDGVTSQHHLNDLCVCGDYIYGISNYSQYQ